MRVRGVLLSVFLLAISTTARPQSSTVCVTHFNNQSNYRWNIYNFDGKGTSLFIPPHATIAISWQATSAVTIIGDIPGRLFKQQFAVRQQDSCIVIQAQGPTDSVTLNKPSTGDITTCAGGC